MTIDRNLLEKFNVIFRDSEESLENGFPRLRGILSDKSLPSATELDLLIGCCAPLWDLRFPIDERTLQAHLLRFSISTVSHRENEPTGIPRMITFGLHKTVIFWSLTSPVWLSDVFPKTYLEEERHNNIPAQAGNLLEEKRCQCRSRVEAAKTKLRTIFPKGGQDNVHKSAIGKLLEEYEKTETSNQYEYRHVKAWSFQLPSSQARDPCNMDRATLPFERASNPSLHAYLSQSSNLAVYEWYQCSEIGCAIKAGRLIKISIISAIRDPWVSCIEF